MIEDQETEFATELSRVARHWRTRLDARFRELGLTQARWMTLVELSRGDNITQRELAAQVGVEGPTLVRLLDGLEAQGLIERRTCPNDRRAKRVCLGPAAGKTLENIKHVADLTSRELLSDIDPDDLSVARRVLAAIATKLENT